MVITAWASLLGTSILWQIRAPSFYENYAVMAGQRPYDLAYINEQKIFLLNLLALNILFYSSLWLVKLSFLLFFWRLGWKVKGPKIWWWCILIITLLTWVTCIATIDYRCLLNPFASPMIRRFFSFMRLGELDIYIIQGRYSLLLTRWSRRKHIARL